MNRFWRKKDSFFALTVALLVMLLIAPASARDLNKLLKGDYQGSSTLSCALAMMMPDGGFDENLQRGPQTAGGVFTATMQGTYSYDGEGGTTSDLEVLVVSTDPEYEFPVSQYDVDCIGTYSVYADMTVEGTSNCEVVRIAPYPEDNGAWPPTPGLYPTPLTLTGTSSKSRIFGAKRGIIKLASDTTPNVETYWVDPANFPGAPFAGLPPFPVSERICTHSGMQFKIWN